MRTIIASLRAETARAVRDTALHVHSELVRDTPKDTSWAAANWAFGIGRPGDSARGADGGGPGGPSRVAHALRRQLAGMRALMRMRLPMRVHITNHVPYIGRLDEGHSPQAPRGFVERAVRRGAAAGGAHAAVRRSR